jgi:hypothetical protein
VTEPSGPRAAHTPPLRIGPAGAGAGAGAGVSGVETSESRPSAGSSPPEVAGPVAGSRPPWGSPARDLAGTGYVLEEYLLRGTAMAFAPPEGDDYPADGRWEAEEWGSAPYCTRLLVLRPTDPDRFNGTVLLNWQNVSAGFETPAPSGGEVYEGYAWVGVSAQEVGLYGMPAGIGRGSSRRGALPLVDHDPDRYGSLSHPGDPGSFSIFGDAARAVGPARSAVPDPLGGLAVARVIAVGGSQSAMRLVAYANALHRRDRVIDGYLLTVWEGRAPRLTDGPLSFGGVRTTIRDDLDVPVLVVNSEFEALPVHVAGTVDSRWIRVWEVAGAPHGVSHAGDPPGDGKWGPNRLSTRPVLESAIRHTHHWVSESRDAPRFDRIEFEIEDGSSPRIRRDERGNALGGIRLPEIAAPTAEYRGVSFGTGSAPLFGASRRFSADLLRTLYPSRQVFERQWCDAVDALVDAGAIRPEDGAAMRSRADTVPLPLD